MAENFRMIFTVPTGTAESTRKVSGDDVKNVTDFHEGIEGYEVTPLVSLDRLAEKAGIEKLLVKNESKRFGLNAFKALGGSWAITKYLCDKFGLTPGKETFRQLTSPEYHERIKDITFITATDGNHGRGVAWYAMKLGCKAVVYLPAGSAEERVENIRKTGAKAEVTAWNYDDTVRFAEKTAKENGWVLVQDTSWDGYEEIPLNVMRGYTTLGKEISEQLREQDIKTPTHVFLQAGVGSMAGAVAGYLTNEWKNEKPKIIIVEPDKADCIFRTAEANDGARRFVTGNMDSMMAGLCCGEPCPLAWDILKETACAYVSCSDDYSAFAMKLLAKPYEGDEPVVSGESGAVCAGVAVKLCTDPALKEYKDKLGIDERSRILVISTEGDTCKENYNKIVNG